MLLDLLEIYYIKAQTRKSCLVILSCDLSIKLQKQQQQQKKTAITLVHTERSEFIHYHVMCTQKLGNNKNFSQREP